MSDAVPNPSENPGQPPANPGASADPTPSPAPEAAKPVVPDSYTFKLPEGQTLDDGFVKAMTPVFKDLGLTQDQVSKLTDPFVKYGTEVEAQREKDFQTYMANLTKRNLDTMRKEWGANYEPNLNIAQSAIARFLPAEAKQKLELSGLGNDPDFMKAFLSIGKMIQEDKPPHAGAPSARKPTTEVFFGSGNA